MLSAAYFLHPLLNLALKKKHLILVSFETFANSIEREPNSNFLTAHVTYVAEKTKQNKKQYDKRTHSFEAYSCAQYFDL